MSSIEYIHATIMGGLRDAYAQLEFGFTNDVSLINELDRMYSRHMLKAYADYESNSNDKSQLTYYETLNRFCIIEKWNKLAPSISKPKINLKPPRKVISNNYCECSCKGDTYLDEISCIFTCKTCGEMKQIDGLLTDQITKSNGRVVSVKNNYKHRVYFMQIYKNLFALENFTFDKDILETIKEDVTIYADRHGINPKQIHVRWFRKHLNTHGLNKWFPHINLLKKEITGYYPPRLDYKELSKLIMYYTVYTKHYDAIFKGSSAKKISYLGTAVIISKILTQFLPDGDRKREILNSIVFPQRDTLEKIDLKYEAVCKESEGILIYRPTIPT